MSRPSTPDSSIPELSIAEPHDPRTEPRFAGLREVLGMAFPIILGMLSFTIMHFVDQVMVSKLGKSELAAVGPASLWVYTLATVFLGIVGCVATFAAQSLGRGRRADCARYTWQGIYFSIGAGLVALPLWFISEPMFRMMGHEEAVTQLEVTYFNIRLISYGLIAWNTALSSFFQAVSRQLVPMYTAIVANLINIVLDYLLIFGAFGFPRWEIAGAAVATNVAIFAQLGMMQVVFLSPRYQREFATRETMRLDLGKLRELLHVGWPAGITSFADVFNWAIFTSFIVGYFGTAQLAAHNVAMSFMHLSFMPIVGFNHAIAAIVGQWIGRGSIATAKARTYTATRIAVAYMLTMGIIMALFGPQLIRLFFSTDPEVVRLGRILLLFAATFQGFDAINIVMTGALRGAGDTRFALYAFLLAGYFFFLPLALLLSFPLGLEATGAWIGATAYIILLSGLFFSRFHGERWRHIRIFAADRVATPAPADAARPE